MTNFQPDYTNIIAVALNNLPARLSLYEHNISIEVVEKIIGKNIADLLEGDPADKEEFFRIYCGFCRDYGYDTVPFEALTVDLIQGGEGLCGRAVPIISNRTDLEAYPWDELPGRWFEKYDSYFEALGSSLPPGMKAHGGVGNGLFETIQDFVPLTDLAFLEMDEPEVYADLWKRLGNALRTIWGRFLEKYGHMYAVCRFGDDLGFKSSLLIRPETVREHIIPQYREIIGQIRKKGKPFLLHSCGMIYEVMDDLIETAGIDAKHSNEDAIAPFTDWVDRYGERIGLFGGFDMNIICLSSEQEIKAYVKEVIDRCRNLKGEGMRGLAFGSGNQIADYVPPSGFIAMTEAVRELR